MKNGFSKLNAELLGAWATLSSLRCLMAFHLSGFRNPMNLREIYIIICHFIGEWYFIVDSHER